MTTTKKSAHVPAIPTGLSFPATLIQPPKSQLVHYEDEVSARIAALDAYAEKLGTGFGIPMTDYDMTRYEFRDVGNPTLAALELMVRPALKVTLERHKGRWGLYFENTGSIANSFLRTEKVQLKDAPLDARERFLAVSHDFFEKYLALCRDRLGKMKAAVGAADATIEALRNMRLE